MYSRLIKGFICGLVISCTVDCKAGDSLIIQKLLQRIEQLQVKEAGVFPEGAFPSYRLYALNKDRQKADVNAFFTGLMAFTMRDIEPYLAQTQQVTAERIILKTLPVYEKFRNRKGRPTYNFWPTDTPAIFPNSGWMNHFNEKQALPDDLDDTGILLLAAKAADSTAAAAHRIMQGFTNNGSGKVKNTFSAYRHIGAYSTWFGKKMPVDFDVCVLANVLYMVQSYNLAWTSADSASARLIVKVLEDRKHVTAAAYVSPHYSRLPVILYHLSRLMSLRPIALLEPYRRQLIDDARRALASSDNFLDQVLLSTSLMRWGVEPPVITTQLNGSLSELIEDESFSFFIANMASMLPDPLKQWMGGTGLGKFYYYCPAYNNMLVLEYLVWKKRMALHL